MNYVKLLKQRLEDPKAVNLELANKEAHLELQQRMLELEKQMCTLEGEVINAKSAQDFCPIRVYSAINRRDLAHRELEYYKELEKELFTGKPKK